MSTDYNFLLSLFLYSLRAITALFWGIFMFLYRKRSSQNFPLGVIFIIIGLLYLRNSFVRLPMIEACDIYNPLSYLVLIFIAPFTIFYAYFSIGEKHSPKHNLMHFIPFLMMLCIWMTLELSDAPRLPFCYSINELVGYIGEYPLFAGFFLLLMLVFFVQVVPYFCIARRRFILIWKDYKLPGVSLRSLRMLIAMDFLFLIYPLTCVVYMSYYNSCNGEILNLFVSVVITALSVLNIKLILPIRTDLSFMPVKGGKKGGTETRRSEVKENCEDQGLAAR